MPASQHRHGDQYVGRERYEADERRRDIERAQLKEDIDEIKDAMKGTATQKSVEEIKESLKFVSRSIYVPIVGIIIAGIFAYFGWR